MLVFYTGSRSKLHKTRGKYCFEPKQIPTNIKIFLIYDINFYEKTKKKGCVIYDKGAVTERIVRKRVIENNPRSATR